MAGAQQHPDPAAESEKHSLYYESCTSEFKDDLPTLASCLKTGQGPHNRTEAAFLLWYHVLAAQEGADEKKMVDLAASGAVQACYMTLENLLGDVTPAEKTASAGLLLAISGSGEEAPVLVVKAHPRAGELLHKLVEDQSDLARGYAARTLRMLAEDEEAALLLMRSMDNHPPMHVYSNKFSAGPNREGYVVAQLVWTLAALLAQSSEVCSAALANGLPVGLMFLLKWFKADAIASGAMACVRTLMKQLPECIPNILAHGGLALFVDLLGPPPKEVVAYERQHFGAFLDSIPAHADPHVYLRSQGSAEAQPSPGTLQQQQQQQQQQHSSSPLPSPSASPSQASLAPFASSGLGSPPKAGASGRPLGQLTLSTSGQSPAGSPKTQSSFSVSVEPSLLRPRMRADPAAPTAQASGHTTSSYQQQQQQQFLRPSPSIGADGVPQLQTSTSGNNNNSSVFLTAVNTPALPGVGSPLNPAHHANMHAKTHHSSMAGAGAGASSPPAGPAALQQLQQPAVPRYFVSRNSVGLKWGGLQNTPCVCSAATCLLDLMGRNEVHVAEANARHAARRATAQLMVLVQAAMDEAGGGRKKKKNLALSGEQTEAATAMTGILRFLARHNPNRYRIAKAGAVPILIKLLEDGDTIALRANAQAILSSVALLAELGQVLVEAGMPEEFLVNNPMRLTPEDVEALQIEFPGLQAQPAVPVQLPPLEVKVPEAGRASVAARHSVGHGEESA